jgi:hypothetical protein
MSDDHDQERVPLEAEAWVRLKGALGDTSSGRRRDEILATDDRSDEDLAESYEALDRALVLLSDRVETPARTAPIARVVDPSQGKGQRSTALTDEERQVLTQRCDLLYEDIVWLFAVNDGEGALISLERMLMLGEPQGDAKEFVETNRGKLLHLYEDYMGPFDRVTRLGLIDAHVEMPAGYLDSKPIAEVLQLVDGRLTISEILDRAEVPTLVGCAALKQLNRAQVVEFD